MNDLPPRHDSIRGHFAFELYKEMKQNPNIWVVTGDLGYKMFDFIRRDFESRFINTGATEAAMLGTAVGLAKEGKIPFCYSISTFLIFRPFELIRNYLHRDQIPVKLVGSGYDKDYEHDGYSHWPLEQEEIMKHLNIKQFYPNTKEEIPGVVKEMISNKLPSYVCLRR